MTSTMEQSTSMPSVESSPGAQTDPLGTMNKLEKATDQLNANMDRIATLLGQLCQGIPTGECSCEARVTVSCNPPGRHKSGCKRQHSQGFSSDEEADGSCMKSHKDSDAISVTASEEEVQNLLDGANGGSTHKNDNHKRAKDQDEKEFTATFKDQDKKRSSYQQTVGRNGQQTLGQKAWRRKNVGPLDQIWPPGKLRWYHSDPCQLWNLAIIQLLQKESQPLACQFASLPKGNVCNLNECR